VHSCQQFPHANRLALEAVEAGGHDLLPLLGHHRGGDRDHRDGASRGIRSKLAKRFDAAYPGQLDVHQDERRVLLARQLHAFFARPGLEGPVALDLEGVAHKLQVLGIVLNDEDQLIRHGAPAT